MKTREKYLAIIFGSIVMIWLGMDYFSKWFTEPLNTLQNQVDALRGQSDTLHEKVLLSARKSAEMAIWRKSSFPSNTVNAQRLYISWLTDLATQSGFKDIVVTADGISTVRNSYSRVPVTIKAKARLQSLAQFIERFESVDLLQRISKIDLSSPSNEGNPELVVSLTAEGVSFPGANDHDRLFPRTELFEAATKDATSLVVVSNNGFPTKFPFVVRVGREYLTVNDIQGNHWIATRGTERSFAENHKAGQTVELFPLKSEIPSPEDIEKIWVSSLFTKPAPLVEYHPKLASASPPPVIRGTPWNWKLDVSGWNPAFGTPKFEILASPPGVEYDDQNSSLVWKGTGDAEIGEHKIDLLVWGTNGRDSGFNPSLSVRVRNPNTPPKFSEQGPFRFFVGRESTIQIVAEDPDANGKPLAYSLDSGPAGMTIDAATGLLKWKPAEDMVPQKLDLKLKVTDADEFPATAETSISVTLEEDSARFTYLTGRVIRTMGSEEVIEAWIYDRAANHTTKLHVGDVFRVADFELELKTIGSTFVILERNGQTYRWNFEQPLTEMQLVPTQPAEKPASLET